MAVIRSRYANNIQLFALNTDITMLYMSSDLSRPITILI